MRVLKASRLPACASWMRACSSIGNYFITTSEEELQGRCATFSWRNLECQALYAPVKPIPDQPPENHAQCRRRSKDSSKNGNHRCVEDESTQDSSQRSGEERGQGGAPELARLSNSFILEEA